MGRGGLLRRNTWLAAIVVCCVVATVSQAAELRKKTEQSFDRYVQLTEQRFEKESDPPAFLAIDRLSDEQRKVVEQRLRNGEVVIERMQTKDNGKEIEVPDGMIHHWRAVVFVPGATLAKTIALVQDYDHHSKIYTPDVERSKLMKRQGNDFHIFYRLRRKKVITVVMDTEYDVHYEPMGPTRMASKSISSRIQEIENPGQANEKAKPVGNDNGFMWRLNSYWHMEERDGGVYIQCEAVSLSRDIPTGLGWMVKPFVESVPKESLMFTLGRTREALLTK